MKDDFLANDITVTYEPDNYEITETEITLHTQPNTDLWQRTYYGFQNDNAPMFQVKTDERYFSFVTKVDFDSSHRFDQAGIVLYLNSDNWIKASIEYENEDLQRLGAVVTNQGYSDWSTQDTDASVKSIWYRLSRRESDYLIEYSLDGKTFSQMRICHLHEGDGEISFGVYACSPEESSFKARFSEMEILPCQWEAHG
ncbi:DUF1349 domain-containing protein [Alkalibacterium sp.]|nr:MAG: DUF1349 domain-containing protein [Alkalibacterium sp.]